MSELFPDRIETERLILEHESPKDADLFERYAYLSTDSTSPEAFEFIPVDPHTHPKETAEMIDSRHERWEQGVGATYVVRPKAGEDGAGLPAGEAELLANWENRQSYFAFGLRKRFWGRGYSGERAAAHITMTFERLDLDLVSVTHVAANENSRRAIQKYVDRFGGRREGCVRNGYVLDGEPYDTVRYTISREEYEASDPDVAVTFHD